MGKAQYKKKTRQVRHNPLRVPDAHLGGGRGDPSKEREVLPILTKLKSTNYADRTWACAAICNLVTNDAATRRLFQGRNVVGELVERLSDDVDEVVVEASGALRNLAIDGGHELCGEMFNKGIMPHLTLLITKITTTIESILAGPTTPLTDTQLQSRKHLLSLAENVLSLIWSLSEANWKSLQAVNASGVERLLWRVLGSFEILGLGTSLAAAQALYALSQDNSDFQRSFLATPNILDILLARCRQDHQLVGKGKGKAKGKATNGDAVVEDDGRALQLRVLISGALRNLIESGSRVDRGVDIATLTNTTILPLILPLLDIDLPEITSRVTQLVTASVQSENNTNGLKGVQTDHRSNAEAELERIERGLSTAITALEILTGICAGLEDVAINEPVPESADDDDEEMPEDDDLADEDLILAARDSANVPEIEERKRVPAETIRTGSNLNDLLSHSLPSKLTALSLPTPLSFPPAAPHPSPHPPTTSLLSTLHLRALEALNNLLLTTAAIAQNSRQTPSIPTSGVWDGMYTVIEGVGAGIDAGGMNARGQEMRVEVLDMAIGCVWGVSRISPDAVVVQERQIQMLFEVMSSSGSGQATTRAIEILSAVAIRSSVSLEENRAIGTWLVQAITGPTLSVEKLITLVDALIDTYADETRAYDQPVFVEGGFLEALTKVIARVRNEVRAVDKRKNPAVRARAEEAYENLAAFLKYRKQLRR